MKEETTWGMDRSRSKRTSRPGGRAEGRRESCQLFRCFSGCFSVAVEVRSQPLGPHAPQHMSHSQVTRSKCPSPGAPRGRGLTGLLRGRNGEPRGGMGEGTQHHHLTPRQLHLVSPPGLCPSSPLLGPCIFTVSVTHLAWFQAGQA